MYTLSIEQKDGQTIASLLVKNNDELFYRCTATVSFEPHVCEYTLDDLRTKLNPPVNHSLNVELTELTEIAAEKNRKLQMIIDNTYREAHQLISQLNGQLNGRSNPEVNFKKLMYCRQLIDVAEKLKKEGDKAQKTFQGKIKDIFSKLINIENDSYVPEYPLPIGELGELVKLAYKFACPEEAGHYFQMREIKKIEQDIYILAMATINFAL